MFKEKIKKISYKEDEPSKWVNDIIIKAINAGASDIHIDPYKDLFLVRFRIDGILRKIDSRPQSFLLQVVSCIKVMAQLNITERRRPQDGHILFLPKSLSLSHPIDLRVSIFPLVIGEAVVIRILGHRGLLFEDFKKLGMASDDVVKLREILQKPSGMILVTGPGGTGKTTTLYTILNSLRSQQRNIVTLEDPVEFHMDGVRQSQICPEIGFDFLDGLKSILRQDPDVVMIGEIRDDKTAEVSIRAALMGSLFLSTIHTTNSVGTIVRFLEFNLPRSLIASSLSLIIAQRLVRLICPYCKAEIKPLEKMIKLSGLSKTNQLKFFEGKGCSQCQNTGYSGRIGIFELMFINKELQRLIIEGAPFIEIEKQAKLNGMHTLREEAMKKALQGITTLEEVYRVTPND